MKYLSEVFVVPCSGGYSFDVFTPQHWFWGVITDNGEIVVAKEISAEFNKLPAEEQARIYLAVFIKLQDMEARHEKVDFGLNRA